MRLKLFLGMIGLAMSFIASARADDPPKAENAAQATAPKPARPRAPADYVTFKSDKAGVYFIPKALNEEYGTLMRRLAGLRTDIAEARLDGGDARNRLETLDRDLQALQTRIEDSKFYVPGVGIQTQSIAQNLEIAPGKMLFIECGDVEIRGWDQPGIQCILHKTVLGDDAAAAAQDFQGIELAAREAKGPEIFGFYQGIADKPDWKAEWERFPFKEFLKSEFLMLTVKGLNHEQGNRQITMEMKNEAGAGMMSSEWRRHGKLTIFMPKGHHVGVRGGLKGFKVQRLVGALSVQGQGDRDYQTIYSVTDSEGPIVIDHLPLHRAENIRGSVAVGFTAYAEDSQTGHDAQGVLMRAVAPRESIYRKIQGDLTLRFCRADLTIEQVRGRLDVENDFGRTVIAVAGLDPARAHRAIAQSGSIELRIPAKADYLNAMSVLMLSECGSVFVASPFRGRFEDKFFTYSLGRDRRRSWQGFIAKPAKSDPKAQPGLDIFTQFERVDQALHGRTAEEPGEPGFDVLNRSGTIRAVVADEAVKAAP